MPEMFLMTAISYLMAIFMELGHRIAHSELLSQPWVGASWEGYVIEQILGQLSSHGRRIDIHYFRTSDQHELDLILDFGKEIWAAEIKLTSSPGPKEMERLDKTADRIKASRRFLISQTLNSSGDDRRISCNLPFFLHAMLKYESSLSHGRQ